MEVKHLMQLIWQVITKYRQASACLYSQENEIVFRIVIRGRSEHFSATSYEGITQQIQELLEA